MGTFFNREPQKERRQKLRNDAPATEKIFWGFLKGEKLGRKFRRQFGVGTFVLDFYCPEAKLAIELDGASHDSEEARMYDHDRDRYLQQFGIRILRFKNNEIYDNIDGVIETIKRTLAA